MTFKETDMLVIGDRYQRVDLDGKVAPVLEKQFDRRQGQRAVEKLFHEGPFGDALAPALDDFPIDDIDVGFGVGRAQFYAEMRNDLAHKCGAFGVQCLAFLQRQTPDTRP